MAASVGGIEESIDKIECLSCNRVVGGASLYGVRDSIMSRDDPFTTNDSSEIISHLTKKYDIKREYNRGIRVLHGKLTGKKAPRNEQVARNNVLFELGKNDPHKVTTKLKTFPLCDITDDKIANIRSTQASPIDGAIALEQLFYPHMVNVEKYYGNAAEGLYEIIRGA